MLESDETCPCKRAVLFPSGSEEKYS
jgi:hypothetical protein